METHRAVSLDTELEVPIATLITLPATDTQYKSSPWSEPNMEPEQLQNFMMLQVEVMLTMVLSYRSRARQKYDKEEE